MASRIDPQLEVIVDRQLERLEALPPNWDHEGAPPIDHAIIEAARGFIGRLWAKILREPAVVPMHSGNLQFEWNEGVRSLEMEIEDARTVRFLKWDPEQGVEEEDSFDIADTAQAVALIEWFMRGTAHD